MSSMNVSEDIFADPSLYNFTKESWNDFLEKMKDHMLKTSNLSKTTTNISKVPANTSDNCLELCGGFMREILTDYRHDYHGIITLGVSEI